jgi:hypothetical protein
MAQNAADGKLKKANNNPPGIRHRLNSIIIPSISWPVEVLLITALTQPVLPAGRCLFRPESRLAAGPEQDQTVLRSVIAP